MDFLKIEVASTLGLSPAELEARLTDWSKGTTHSASYVEIERAGLLYDLRCCREYRRKEVLV